MSKQDYSLGVSLGKSLKAARQLQKLYSVADPLLEDDSGPRDTHLTSLELRNRLLGALKKFPDLSLQFRQSRWAKFEYTDRDTDLSAAIKTLFNLLYQVHEANAFHRGQGPLRHRHWPLHEILELIHYRDVLTSIFREEEWRDTLSFLNHCWQGCGQFIEQTDADVVIVEHPEEDKIVEGANRLKDLSNSYLQSNSTFDRICYLIKIYKTGSTVTDTIDEKSTTLQKLAKLVSELFIYLDYVETRLGAPGLLSAGFTQKLLELVGAKEGVVNPLSQALLQHLGLENGQFFVKKRLEINEKRLTRLDAQISAAKPVDSVKKFYAICAALYAPSQRKLPEGAIDFFDSDNESAVQDYLELMRFSPKDISVEKFITLVKDSVQGASLSVLSKRQYNSALFHFVSEFGREANRCRGLEATKKNMQNLQIHLTEQPSTSGSCFNLYTTLEQAKQSVADFKSRLSDDDKAKFSGLLDKMSAHLPKLQALSIDVREKKPGASRELVKKYQALERIYAQLTGKIPLACQKFLERDIEHIRADIQQFRAVDPDLEEVYQKMEKEKEKAHTGAIQHGLKGVLSTVEELHKEFEATAAVSAPSIRQSITSAIWGVAKLLPLGVSDSTPVEDEAKADCVDYLESLHKNILGLQHAIEEGENDSKRLPLINSVARTIFDLRLAHKALLQKHTTLTDALTEGWEELNISIEHLRQRDPLFADAIMAEQPAAVVENRQWREKLSLGEPVLGLGVPAPGQVLETLHTLSRSIRDKLAAIIIDKQPPDNVYYLELHQDHWQKFALDDKEAQAHETTETYTLKLLLNLLYQVHEATKPDISDWSVGKWIPGAEWAIRLSQLPIQEIAGLVQELPVFLANSGIAAKALEVMGFVKLIAGMSGASGPQLTEWAATADQRTATPAHAFAYSGLVSKEVPEVLKIIAHGARIKQSVAKIEEHEKVKDAALEQGVKPYVETVSDSWGVKIQNWVKNAGILFWNTLVRPVDARQQYYRRVVPQYKAIAGEALSAVKPSAAQDLVNPQALLETGKKLNEVLIGLDGLAAQSGLRQHEKLVEKVAKKANIAAKSADHSMRSALISAWEIVASEPFLVKRLQAQQQALAVAQAKVDVLRDEAPSLINRWIEFMKNPVRNDKQRQEFIDGRSIIMDFLQKYVRENKQHIDERLQQLTQWHENKLAEFEKSGDSVRRIAKNRKSQQAQYEKACVQLRKGSSKVEADKLDWLFDTVLQSPHASIADELSDHVARQERVIHSAQEHVNNLRKGLTAKQDVLYQYLETECDTLKHEAAFCFRGGAVVDAQLLQSFEEDCQRFLQLYQPIQADRHCVPVTLRGQIQSLCETVAKSPLISAPLKSLAEALKPPVSVAEKSKQPEISPVSLAENPAHFLHQSQANPVWQPQIEQEETLSLHS